MFLLAWNPNSKRYSMSSRYQYFPLSVVPCMDIADFMGEPQSLLYSGNKMPKIFVIVTKILVQVFICRKVPMKSSCFTQTLSQHAYSKNIFNYQKYAVRGHLSSVTNLLWKSPLMSSLVLSLSRDPSLFIFTLNVSMRECALQHPASPQARKFLSPLVFSIPFLQI